MVEPIIMRGFFISISLPSEALLQRRFRDEEIIIDEVQKAFDLIAQKFITRFKTPVVTSFSPQTLTNCLATLRSIRNPMKRELKVIITYA